MVLVLDAAGWLGGVFVVVGYVLISTRRITADSPAFQVLNIAGGVLLTGTALYRGALPNTVINVVWIVFGVYALASTQARQEAADDSEPDAKPADEPDEHRQLSSAPSAVVSALCRREHREPREHRKRAGRLSEHRPIGSGVRERAGSVSERSVAAADVSVGSGCPRAILAR